MLKSDASMDKSNVTSNIARWAFDGLMQGSARLYCMDAELVTIDVEGFHYTFSREIYSSLISGEFYLSFLTPTQAQVDYYCAKCEGQQATYGLKAQLNKHVANQDYEKAAIVRDLINANTNSDDEV